METLDSIRTTDMLLGSKVSAYGDAAGYGVSFDLLFLKRYGIELCLHPGSELTVLKISE